MKKAVEKLEALLELGGIRKDIVLLAISAALAVSIFKPFPLPFDAAWVAIILCRLPIIAEAFCGLVRYASARILPPARLCPSTRSEKRSRDAFAVIH